MLNGSQIRDVFAGYRHTCMLSGRGKVICFGWNQFNQAAPPLHMSVGVNKMSMGFMHSCAMRLNYNLNNNNDIHDSDTIFCWGSNLEGQTLVMDGLKNNDVKDVCVG